jgi:NAD+ synthase (glutamine-hydrolysing)
MKIGIAQLNPIVGDISGNTKKILSFVEKSYQQGVELLLTPELSLCGYPPRDLLLTPDFVDLMTKELQNLADLLPENISVLVGTVTHNYEAFLRGEKNLFNSIACLKKGTIEQIFNKQLLPTYDVFDEDRYFAPGEQLNCLTYFLAQDQQLTIGVTICEDLWNDEQFWGKRSYKINPIENLAKLGVDLIVNLSASPYRIGQQKLRESMLNHATNRYQIPIIYTNQVGGNDDLIFDGCSVAFNTRGEIVSRGKSFAEDLLIIEYNEEINDLINPNKESQINSLPTTEEEEIFAALVLGVRDYCQKCGFSKVILGLSGGIDSSLVAVIATEAVGPTNVLGVLMPSPYSSDHSISDAEALVANLGIKSEKLEISSAMKVYDEILAPLFADTEFGVAEENIQSRIRGNLLMAIANKFGYLLLSTGNKSEMAVGYCTLYGDMNGGLSVIADVPKTKVFAICEWLNQHKEIIPHNVLIKPPSAELKPGQVDQDSLPPYNILDEILDRIIHLYQSPNEIIKAGYDQEIVNKVIKLVNRAEFKRRQAPPGLKITDRAFGTGWRMPIAMRYPL